MTQDRIQYFEKVLSKPQPEPFKSWIEELFNEAKGGRIYVEDHDRLAKMRDKPRKNAPMMVLDTPENTDA